MIIRLGVLLSLLHIEYWSTVWHRQVSLQVERVQDRSSQAGALGIIPGVISAKILHRLRKKVAEISISHSHSTIMFTFFLFRVLFSSAFAYDVRPSYLVHFPSFACALTLPMMRFVIRRS